MSDKENNIIRGFGDLLITDVFMKHNVNLKKRELTPEQKEQIKSLVQDLQQQVDQFLNQNKQTDPAINAKTASAPTNETSEPARPRRRLTLKRNAQGTDDTPSGDDN